MLGPVLDALAYLHEKSLVHGGLKPSNILVVNDQVKLSIEEVQAAGNVNRPAQYARNPRRAGVRWGDDLASRRYLVARRNAGGGIDAASASLGESGAERPGCAGVHAATLRRDRAGGFRTDPARRCSLGDIGNRLEGAQSARNPAGKAVGTGSAKLRGVVLAAAAVIVIALIAIFSMRSRQTPQPAAADGKTIKPSPPIATPPAQSPVTKTRSSKGASAPVKGEVVEQVLPEVSPKAMASIHGQFGVRVRVEVDAAGAVSDATLDSPGPSQYFAKAALEAARHWKFKPVQVKGKPVASVWMLQFQFTQGRTRGHCRSKYLRSRAPRSRLRNCLCRGIPITNERSSELGIVMKPLIFALCVVFAFSGLSAQTPVWQPSPGHTQVPIWPGAAPDAQPVAGPEVARRRGRTTWSPAGRWLRWATSRGLR